MVLDDSPGNTKGTKFSNLHRVLGQTWLTTIGPLISVTVLFAKLAEGQYGRSVLEQLHSDENIKIMHIHLLALLHSSGPPIGRDHCCGGSGSVESPTLLSSSPPYLTCAWKLQSLGEVSHLKT